MYDVQMLVWGIIGVALIVALEIVRPPEYTYHFVFNIIIVFIIYFGIPNRLVFSFSIATLVTAGELLRYFLIRDWLDYFTLIIAIDSLLLANIVGFMLSARLYYYWWQQFLAQVQVEELRVSFKQLAATDPRTGVCNSWIWRRARCTVFCAARARLPASCLTWTVSRR